MLTRFIASQHDHGGYLCMGINSSLSLQKSWHLPPSSLSLAGQALESLARKTIPPCLPSFPPSLSPHSPTSLTFNQTDYYGVSSSNASPSKRRSVTPSSQNVFQSGGVESGHQPTSQHLHRVNYNWSMHFAHSSYFYHSFVPRTVYSWNNLPTYLTSCESVSSFKYHLITYFN